MNDVVMNNVVLSKDNWLNEVEAFITGKTFEKIDDNTYRKESIQYAGGQTIIINGQRMEQPGQQVKITQSVTFNEDGWVSNLDDSNKQGFTQVVFGITAGDQENIYEECIYWNDANRVKELINQIFRL